MELSLLIFRPKVFPHPNDSSNKLFIKCLEIVDKNIKIVLGSVWSLIRKFKIEGLQEEGMFSLLLCFSLF
jgi:hypothetical protein